MCTETDRRAFIKQLLTLNLGAALLPSFGWLGGLVQSKVIQPSLTSPLAKSIEQLMASAPFDKVDRKANYLDGTDMSFWHRQIHPVITSVLPKLGVPRHGSILEIGVYKGDSFHLLSQTFGSERVRGIDLCRYIEDPRILNSDVRALKPEHDMPLAVAWNDVSTWKGSPRSKMAAFEYARRNLVVSGLYIDESFSDLPKDLPLSDFKLVYSVENISVFRRIRVST